MTRCAAGRSRAGYLDCERGGAGLVQRLDLVDPQERKSRRNSAPTFIGTTCGMMLANIPAVLIGHRLADRLPVRVIRIAAAVVFATLAR